MGLQSWQRQKGESIQAFTAFMTYLGMGEERTLAKVSAKHGKHVKTIEKWSARDGWVTRVEDYEREQDRLLWKERERQRREMLSRHASICVAFQQQLVNKLKKFIESDTVMDLKPADMAKWLEVSAKIERLARGMATEHVETREQNRGPGQDGVGSGADHLARRILADPEARKLALDLFDRLAGSETDGAAEPGGTGAVSLPWAVEVGPPPEPAQPSGS